MTLQNTAGGKESCDLSELGGEKKQTHYKNIFRN